MKIDFEKLKGLIEKEIVDMNCGYHCESEIPIGFIDGIQITVRLTDDEDEMIDLSEELICIE